VTRGRGDFSSPPFPPRLSSSNSTSIGYRPREWLSFFLLAHFSLPFASFYLMGHCCCPAFRLSLSLPWNLLLKFGLPPCVGGTRTFCSEYLIVPPCLPDRLRLDPEIFIPVCLLRAVFCCFVGSPAVYSPFDSSTPPPSQSPRSQLVRPQRRSSTS